MLPVVLVLLGLFLAGFARVLLKDGMGHLVAGGCLVVLSVSAALIPLADGTDRVGDRAAGPQPYVMQVLPR